MWRLFLDYDSKRMCQWSLPIIKNLPVTTQGHYKIPSGQSVFWLAFELKTSQIQSIQSGKPHFIHLKFNIKLAMFSVFFFLPASLLPAINKEPIFKLKKKKLTSMTKCTTPTTCCFLMWPTKIMWKHAKPNVTLSAWSWCSKFMSRYTSYHVK